MHNDDDNDNDNNNNDNDNDNDNDNNNQGCRYVGNYNNNNNDNDDDNKNLLPFFPLFFFSLPLPFLSPSFSPFSSAIGAKKYERKMGRAERKYLFASFA